MVRKRKAKYVYGSSFKYLRFGKMEYARAVVVKRTRSCVEFGSAVAAIVAAVIC